MLRLKIDSVFDETATIRVFTLCREDGSALPAYSAGAHVDIDLGDLRTRSYSLIDWPGTHGSNDRYTFAVQREEDGTGGSKAMHNLRPGEFVEISEPTNDFELMENATPVLLLAGGIGITPLISMATNLSSGNRPFSFHYSARSSVVMGFREQLLETFPDQLNLYFDDECTLDLANLMTSQSPETHIYICGPKAMIDAAKNEAMAAGLPETNIHVELFSTPESQSDDTPFEVEIHDTGQVFTIPVGKSIIDILEEQGVDLMYDCQRGDCGICQTDVISGKPDHRDVVLSHSDRESGKVMQICVSRSKSPRLVLDL